MSKKRKDFPIEEEKKERGTPSTNEVIVLTNQVVERLYSESIIRLNTSSGLFNQHSWDGLKKVVNTILSEKTPELM